ncbi:MAG: phosphate signaling complex PhoU family protein [Acidimicrobiales bacterium]
MVRRLFSSGIAQPDPETQDRSVEQARFIDRQVIQLFALVEEAVAGATHALLTGDREAARELVAKDTELDALYRDLQSLVHELVMEGGLSANRKRWLLALLSMLPELERSGDLAEHVAQRAIRNLPAEMPARVRGFIERMGEIDCVMWKMAADAYADRSESSQQIDLLDDELDDLHVQLIAEIAGGSVPVPVAIELALVGRFYERLGDHAVNITRRVPPRLRNEAIN